ncbi:MAG: choice-of-anchor V domain-containing protein [Candidatus Odinarchaeota archaeon]
MAIKNSNGPKSSMSRKKIVKLAIGFTAITILILVLLGSTTGDAMPGGTASSCTCHGMEGDTITITVKGLPETDGYEPGKEYNVTVSASDTILPEGSQGVWISTDKGTLKAIDANLRAASDDLVQTTTVASEWEFNWTAPASGSGRVSMKVVALVGDGAGASGDSWGKVEFVMNEFVPQQSGGGTTPAPSVPNFMGDVIIASIFGTVVTLVLIGGVIGADIRDRRKQE